MQKKALVIDDQAQGKKEGTPNPKEGSSSQGKFISPLSHDCLHLTTSLNAKILQSAEKLQTNMRLE